jgi:hypothetical protein
MRMLIIARGFAGLQLGSETQTLVQKMRIPAAYTARQFMILVLQLAKYLSQR